MHSNREIKKAIKEGKTLILVVTGGNVNNEIQPGAIHLARLAKQYERVVIPMRHHEGALSDVIQIFPPLDLGNIEGKVDGEQKLRALAEQLVVVYIDPTIRREQERNGMLDDGTYPEEKKKNC